MRDLKYLLPYAITALVFVISLQFVPYTGSVLVKIIPMGILIAYAMRRYGGGLLLLSLCFSTLGDIILELDRAGLFAFGLGAFLIAHLFYIAIFVKSWHFTAWKILPAALVVGWAGYVFLLIAPNLGPLQIPVIAYIFALALMAVTAVFRNVPDFYITASGAALFVLSDSLIALNKFHSPVPYARELIMTTYYTAQGLIVWGKLGQRSFK